MPARLVKSASASISLAVVLLPFAYALDAFDVLHRYLLEDQFIILELGMGMALVFWRQAAFSQERTASRLDVFLGVTALLVTLWAAIRFEHYGYGLATYSAEPLALSILLIAMTLECCRRYAGLPMSILLVAFLLYGYFGQYMPTGLTAPAITAESYLTYIVIGGDALLGRALVIISTIVAVFVLFGKMFEFAGGAEFIKDLAVRFTAASRGAPIKVAILASGLIGSIIGSTTRTFSPQAIFRFP